ncbi:glycosyltransferase [bacterium]|nr:glycosyltransferase [bacterium]
MKSASVKVSVIVPIYNVAPWLARCLDSLVGQTLSDIEIICIDDKSTDNSLEILHQYADRFPQIHVIEMPKNAGVSTARNAGLDAVHGEYIGFVDSDDYVDLDFYEKLYRAAIAGDCDIVKGNAETDFFGQRKWDETSQLAKIQRLGKWAIRHPWHSTLFRAKLIIENGLRFKTDMQYGEDGVFLTECVAAANTVDVCMDAFYHYIRRDDSLATLVLGPDKIESELKSVGMICNIYNKATDITKEAYIESYFQCWHRLIKYLLCQNTSDKCRKKVIEKFVSLYADGKYKSDLLKKYLDMFPYFADHTRYIQSYDYEGLFALIEAQRKKINLGSDKYSISLFGIFDILQIEFGDSILCVRLLGLQVFKFTNAHANIRLSIFYVPIFRIKGTLDA